MASQRDIASAVRAWRDAERDFAEFGAAGGDREPWLQLRRVDPSTVRCRLSPLMRGAYRQLSRSDDRTARSSLVLDEADVRLRRRDAGRHARSLARLGAIRLVPPGRLHVVSDRALGGQERGDALRDRAEDTEIAFELSAAIDENDRRIAGAMPGDR